MTTPGWYNDEFDPNLARWHDGAGWTEHTLVKADWAGPGAPPPPLQPAFPTAPTAWVPRTDLVTPLTVPEGLLAAKPTLAEKYRGLSKAARVAIPTAAFLLALGAIGAITGPDETPLDTEDAATSFDRSTTTVDVRSDETTTTERQVADDAESTTTTTTVARAATTTRPVVTTAPPTTRAPVVTAPPTTKAPVVTAPPITQAPQPSCHPSYSGCLKANSTDYDCAGGEGNGPDFIQGPVTILGDDPFGLDHDNDGVGCES